MVIHSYHTAVVSRAIQMENKKKNIVCIAEFPLFELSARIIMRRKKIKYENIQIRRGSEKI